MQQLGLAEGEVGLDERVLQLCQGGLHFRARNHCRVSVASGVGAAGAAAASAVAGAAVAAAAVAVAVVVPGAVAAAAAFVAAGVVVPAAVASAVAVVVAGVVEGVGLAVRLGGAGLLLLGLCACHAPCCCWRGGCGSGDTSRSRVLLLRRRGGRESGVSGRGCRGGRRRRGRRGGGGLCRLGQGGGEFIDVFLAVARVPVGGERQAQASKSGARKINIKQFDVFGAPTYLSSELRGQMHILDKKTGCGSGGVHSFSSMASGGKLNSPTRQRTAIVAFIILLYCGMRPFQSGLGN